MSLESIQIRPGRPSEAPLVSEVAIRAKGHWGYDEALMAGARRELTLSEGDIDQLDLHVAVHGEHIVGFYAISGEPPEGELSHLFVDPIYIGTGLGGMLWRHAMERAHATGFLSLLIESDPNAEGFYLHHGAKRISFRVSPSTGRHLPLLEVDVSAAGDLRDQGSV